MLRGHPRGRTVGATEDDGTAHLPAGHVARFRSGIDDLVNRLHGEIPGHEFDNGFQPGKTGTHTKAGEAMFGDWRIDHAARAKFIQQALADFVGALIFRDFLAHQEHVFVAAHFFGHRIAQGFAHGHGHHFGALRKIRVGQLHCLFRRGRRSRFLFGSSRLCRRLLRSRCRIGAFAIDQQGGDGLVHLHPFGAFGHQKRANAPFIDGFKLHRRLVGFDLGEHVARFDRIAFFDEPFCELAFLHRGRKGGHENVCGHQAKTSV